MPTAPALRQDAPAAPDASAFVISSYVVGVKDQLQLHDMDSDGLRDLVRITPTGLEVYRLRADGSFPPGADVALPWPSDDVAWNVTDADGDGRIEVLMLVDARHLASSTYDGTSQAFLPSVELLHDTGAALPRGVREVPFAQDVDDDGLPDIVIPGPGVYRIHRRRQDGSLRERLDVACEPEVRHRMGDPRRTDGRFEQQLLVPWFGLRDIDGDGSEDLVSKSDQRVLFYLSRPELPVEPSWRLDLRPEGQQPAGFRIDLDDLFGNLDQRMTWSIADVDGQAPNDLLVQQAGTFRLYLGGSTRGPQGVPDQVLKSSGNVLHFMLRDVIGDSALDLQIIRGETISLGRVLRWLVMPGSLDFDVFTYENVGGRQTGPDGQTLWFTRSPTRRSTLRLEIPGLISFMEDMEETGDELRERRDTPSRRLCLDGDAVFDDVVDVRDGQLLVFRGGATEVAPTPLDQLDSFALDDLLETFILRDLDALADGGVRSIELEDLRELDLSLGWSLRQATLAATPDIAMPLEGPTPSAIAVTDLDGDGRSDVLLSLPVDGEARHVQLAVQRPRP